MESLFGGWVFLCGRPGPGYYQFPRRRRWLSGPKERDNDARITIEATIGKIRRVGK